MSATWLWLALVVAAPAHAQSGCLSYANDPDSLTALEPAATKGALGDAAKECLERNYLEAEDQTVKDKISRVLLVNAYAYSTKYWASLVERHLDEVDQSDPDIAYLYAYYLFNTDRENADQAIRWAEVALERRETWTGHVFVSRVFGLMKLRTIAANAQWSDAEDRQARGEVDVDVDRLRNNTKTFARDWLDFARVSGRDHAEALSLCLSAANKSTACGLDE